jgi:aspartate carbamoyltransferase catalytic subunit
VARSNIHLLAQYHVDLVLCGPAALLPAPLLELAPRITLTSNIEEAVTGADVVMMLRVQLERQHETTFPKSEYFQFFGLRREHLRLARPNVIVMHPGPINRGREIASDVADSPNSVILNQVENGVAIRMAVLEQVAGSAAPAPQSGC